MTQGRLVTEEVVLRPGGGQDDAPVASPADGPVASPADGPVEGPGDSPSDDSAAETERSASPRELPLLDAAESDAFLARWTDVQARFVDDPQQAVQEGDRLVTEVVQALTASFARHKEGLEQSWRSGDEPGTEQLRRALQQYRSFFQRLLAT